MLSPLLYSLITHDCVAKHDSNTIIKLVNLITNIVETAYWEEVRDLAVWCQDSNLSLNVSKTKEMIVDYRKRRSEHAPIHIINRAVVEQGDSFKFLGVHITNKSSWSKHTKTVVKRAQHIFPPRRPKIFGMGPQILKRFTTASLSRASGLVWQLLDI